jgi:hypothetical protein
MRKIAKTPLPSPWKSKAMLYANKKVIKKEDMIQTSKKLNKSVQL